MATAVNVSATNNAEIDGLLSGYKWSGAITYSFPDAASDYASSYAGGSGEPTKSGFASAPSQMQAAINYAIGLILGYTSASIQYAGTNGADIMIAQSPSANPTSYAYYPGNYASGGDVWFGTGYDYTQAKLGNYFFTTALHELGHALGLKHSQEAGGPANVAVPSAHDDSEYTVMSYRSYVGASTTSGYTNEAYGYPQTYMANDILALQTMYGANYTTQGGTTVYTWSPTTGQEFINGAGRPADNGGAGGSANRIYETIWDGGGVDTYDLSNYTTNLSINLNPGASSVFSSVQLANLGNGHYASGNVYNAYLYNGDARSYIDNAIGGSGNDTILGNAIANTLNGGLGADTMKGGLGDDVYVVDNPNDLVIENPNEGADSVQTTLASYYLAANVENLSFADNAPHTGIGNSLDNAIVGGGGSDTLSGGAPGDGIASFGAWNDWGSGVTAGDQVVDVNGDHMADLVHFGANQVSASLSNGSSFGSWAHWATGITSSDQVIDLNGDGNADLLQLYHGRALVALSNGSAFGPWTDWTTNTTSTDRAVDVNGDHMADLVQFGPDSVSVALSNGTSFGHWQQWATGITPDDQIVDLNGDGNADLLQLWHGRALVALSNGSGFGAWQDWTTGVTSSDKAIDVNGDHMADLLQFSTENVKVALSTGTSFGPGIIGTGGITPSDKPIDVNGDGSADLVQFYQGRAIVALNQPGTGNDTLTGGAGSDNFIFELSFGNDIVTDFHPGSDTIQLDKAMFLSFADVSAHTADDGLGNTVIAFDANNTIALDGVLKASLSASDFHFV
ncbi:M10 family metallopeptidase C-terminal domain-containing protein [Bradyrhizobium sp. WSM471]|uniref:M10 family metallopeptidase C-terminal domain-containing protein n=1 Tax=Bradyrhizobium sp. WSM471 TaxID=319017 RepID=UPI00024D2C2F|nr:MULTISPECIES: M10 family metallopeptidase C-terminal domain-containing protein [Bradyrhizobium]EHR04634.1 Matrixin/Peptidase M10 serralysin [Bradyrhizobium sp. WSM471]UFW39782.1 M10 family metallopeptidase C-terminal domain-containing protein [Bradyrhizobium canariense]